jgi:soluble cytochrome b562
MRCASSVAVVAAIATVCLAFAPGEKGDGDRLRGLFKEKTRTVARQEVLRPAKLATLLSASAISNDVVKDMHVYDVELDGKEGVYHVVLMDLAWGRKPARIAVAVNPAGELHDVSITDEYGKKQKELDVFLAQFQGEYALRLTTESLKPIGDVAKLRDSIMKATKAPLKPDEKLRYGLVLQRAQMWKLDELSERIEIARKDGNPIDAELKLMRAELERVSALTAHMTKLLKPKELGQFKQHLDGMKTSIDAALARIAEGKVEEASKAVKAEVLDTCAKCHGSDANTWRRPLQSVLREEREKLAGKDGVFVVEFDVKPMSVDLSDAQTIASSIKAALLLGGGKL